MTPIHTVPDYTVVVAIDNNHVDQALLSIPTWLKNKPSLIERPWLVIVDIQCNRIAEFSSSLTEVHRRSGSHKASPVHFTFWPNTNGIEFEGDETIGRFGDAQRHKMLSGFVHATAANVKTPYWLKLDLDVLATGEDDWIDKEWFEDWPAIIAHPWGYTKPPNQMQLLDKWVEDNTNELTMLDRFPRLNLIPSPDATSVSHKRIISWCGFFNTAFTKACSHDAELTCGPGQLPVPSQDGFMWYYARRTGEKIVRTNMKSRGWKHCANIRDMKRSIEEMNNVEKPGSPSLRISGS